jgi:hypothetical protein
LCFNSKQCCFERFNWLVDEFAIVSFFSFAGETGKTPPLGARFPYKSSSTNFLDNENL